MIGGLFSVALSLGLPPLDVIQHSDPVEPGLSSRRAQTQPAAIQPSDLIRCYGHNDTIRQASAPARMADG